MTLGAVHQDARPCPFCDQPISGRRVLALLAAGFRWADQLCAIKMSGGRSAMLPRVHASSGGGA